MTSSTFVSGNQACAAALFPSVRDEYDRSDGAIDEVMMDWLSVVRMADQEVVRWLLRLCPTGTPTNRWGVRRGNQWIARLVTEELLQRAQPALNDRSIIWATHQGIGLVAPNLYRQTTLHEIAVAAVSARYLARGYTWFRDRRPASLQDHQVDGVAIRGDIVELAEVELTPKSPGRYKVICNSHAARMNNSRVTRVVYLGTPDAIRIVGSQADKFIFRDQRPVMDRPKITTSSTRPARHSTLVLDIKDTIAKA